MRRVVILGVVTAGVVTAGLVAGGPVPAAADRVAVPQAARARDAKASSSVEDASGLTIERTWRISAADPETLTATIRLTSAHSAPVTTTLVEPIPTTSLKRIVFRPKKTAATVGDGLARIDVAVSSGSRLELGYVAKLTRARKASAQDRLAAVQAEMDAAIAAAQPTDADWPLAATMSRYVGTMQVSEETSSGLTIEQSAMGERTTISLRLTTTPYCQVVARGCGFPAQDSYPIEPRLATLDPSGVSLVSSGSADLADSGMTCDGTPQPGLSVKTWTLEPRVYRLTWGGWQVSQAQYTIVTDVSSPANGRCVASSVHIVETGLLTG